MCRWPLLVWQSIMTTQALDGALPDEWGQFLTFGKTVRWRLGRRSARVNPCLQPSPGHGLFVSSGAAPACHRRTGIDSALLPQHRTEKGQEAADERPFHRTRRLNGLSFFLDDADSPQLVQSSQVSKSGGKPIPLQLQQRRRAAEVGLVYSEEKAVDGQTGWYKGSLRGMPRW